MGDIIDARRSAGRRPGPVDRGTWALTHRPQAAREARQITEGALAQWKVAPEARDLVLLAVSELVTNAVEHAAPPLVLHLSRDPHTGQVHVEVTDGGPAAEEGDWAASCAGGEHGRGLAIIDRIAVAHGDGRQADRATYWADLPVVA
ncbi:ATP-binding protein [Streptomyces sp. GD-15H]|uniref:ATP-binding protein n=1 Tax=Streptomyces sp. GD-15H TaxID=3129112 RepID=UPI0032461145